MAEILKLKRIVDIEYNDITIDSNIYHDKLRVFLKDGSIADLSGSQRRYPDVSRITGKEGKSMGRCIVMIISLIHAGGEFLPTPGISIMARKTIQKRAE